MLAYAYWPQAVIKISAREMQRVVTQEITLSTHTTEPDFSKFVLPARVIEASVDERRMVERAGAKTSDDFARGRIVLINNLDEPQELLPKSHLRHEEAGTFFLTDTPVTIPPRNKVAMTITAKDRGAAGNVSPGTFIIDRLPESIKSEVYGESSEALTGGVVVESPLTEEEIQQARESFLGELSERVRGQMTAASGGAPLRADLTRLETQAEEVSAEAGSKTKEFSIRIQARGRAFQVSDNDLLSLTLLALRSNVDPNEEFISYQPDSFQLDVARVDFERGEARVVGKLTGTYAAKVGPTVLRSDNLAGLSADEVRAHFAGFSEVGEVNVTFSPFWVRSVPARSEAVEIVLKEPVQR